MSGQFDTLTINVGELWSRRAVRRGLLGVAAGVLGSASAIARGDLTSEAKPKRKRKQRRKGRKRRQCSGADDCLAPENPCETAICRRHRCRVRNRLDGTGCGDERECRDGACVVPCGGVCAGGRICQDDSCVCPETGECEISPAQRDGWSIHDEERVSFVDGPGEPPLGTGSVRLSTIDDLGSAIDNDLFDGLPIAEISALSFATYVEDGAGGADGVPSVEFEILFGEGIELDTATLVFEPKNTVDAPVVPDDWQTWDAVGDDARWAVEDGPGCDETCLMSWSDVLAAFPGARILGLLVVRSGSGASDAAGHRDALNVNGLIYNFELDAP